MSSQVFRRRLALPFIQWRRRTRRIEISREIVDSLIAATTHHHAISGLRPVLYKELIVLYESRSTAEREREFDKRRWPGAKHASVESRAPYVSRRCIVDCSCVRSLVRACLRRASARAIPNMASINANDKRPNSSRSYTPQQYINLSVIDY